ncbi:MULTISPECIES: primosomal replication protein N [Niveibacterium]|uniref:Replication restart protein PriB n=1 Tax=Niveibacterium microcysteis TaxID=2811415 RepID=A0ABX7M276_9RHOO|nr:MULTISPECIES: primosomal replication protein N [Niveibacterium]QSI75867.1 primosomal replication protein N [Niveibacterium microcysteis]
MRNALVLDGVIAECGVLRRTPAGMPVLEFSLEHVSRQIEAGIEREVRCEVSVLALGDAALSAQARRPGDKVTLTGFLAARSARHKGLVMHVNTIEILEGN